MELLIKKPELELLAKKILRGIATETELQSAKLEDVKAIKSDTGAVHYRSGGLAVEKAAEGRKRSQRYVASDETADRMGDVILVPGWDTKRFEENAQALWSHDAKSFPVGSVSDVRKGQRDGRSVLLETINYAEAGTDPRIDTLFKLVEQDIVKAVSVGFLPVKSTWVEDPKERSKLGLGPMGMLFEKQEQLELSNCTIPANPNALATKSIQEALRDMIASGQITQRDAEAVAEIAAPERKIQVQGVGIPAQAEASADEFFELGPDGKLRKISPLTAQAEEIKSGDPLMDLAALVASLDEGISRLELQIAELSRQMSELPEKTGQAITRSSSDQRVARRSILASAVERAREQLAKEQVAKEKV